MIPWFETMNQRDSIYARPQQDLKAFVFDEQVASVFPDMINRSVPGYGAVVSMVGFFAGQYAQADSICYDLGCSLGASTISMRNGIQAPGCRVVAVDNAEAMTNRCREYLREPSHPVPVDVVCADIRNVEIAQASFVVLNYTLQFIPSDQRASLLRKIYEGMLPGGALLLSEKVAFADPDLQLRYTELHHAFKRANGYSDLEISQKRTALENVLVPDTVETHLDRLTAAGFTHRSVWHQCLNFVSMMAIK